MSMYRIMHRIHRGARGQRGFTLLLAALISSIVLALGASIYELASKEIQLSAIGRDSQFAFYAADTAAECALYWDARTDIHPDTFATSSASSPAASVDCDQQTAAVTVQQPAQTTAATSTFEVDLFSDVKGGPYCADVTIAKWYDGSAERTTVSANGYSVSCTALGTPSIPALQRSVELKY